VRSSGHVLDWPNQPLPFKIYTSLEPLPLPVEFTPSGVTALEAIAGLGPTAPSALDREMLARLAYFSNGVTRVLRRMPFRAAACTGALYHIELYFVCGDLPDLEAGVYHYGAHDNALRLLRRGDFRAGVVSAAGAEEHVLQAPVVAALTSTWWRNAWKYQSRAYRHAFWDSGTILANLLGAASANGVESQVVVGFADEGVNALLDMDPVHEATICLVALGAGAAAPPPDPLVARLELPTRRLSHHEVQYPMIVEAHRASSLRSGADARQWRASVSTSPTAASPRMSEAGPHLTDLPRVPESDGPRRSIEEVILRRGSSRRFSREPITRAQLELMLEVATAPFHSDVPQVTDPYVIVNAVDGLDAGAYVYDRRARRMDLLKQGEFRREAAFLDLGQDLAGDAASNVYWLADLAPLGDRGYRAAQLEAAIEGGKLYLAAYALGLGATGLTFFDDEVTTFFSPDAEGKSVMFLTAVGHPQRAR
jgi:SagB-type dehydrogenase family enzyme